MTKAKLIQTHLLEYSFTVRSIWFSANIISKNSTRTPASLAPGSSFHKCFCSIDTWWLVSQLFVCVKVDSQYDITVSTAYREETCVVSQYGCQLLSRWLLTINITEYHRYWTHCLLHSCCLHDSNNPCLANLSFCNWKAFWL